MATGPDNEDAPLAEPASDRCSNCGTPLATDQRYCVNCGERRGKPRFGALAAAAPAAEPVAAAAVPPDRSRFSPATTLVAGVATLLLAMGVGVLIGEDGTSNAKQAAAQSPIITLNDGGASNNSGSSGGGSSRASTGSSHSHKGSSRTAASHSHKSSHRSGSSSTAKSSPTVIHVTKKVQGQMKQALNNVVGTNSNIVTPTTQVGGKCTNGQAGCQNGKFTGNFFGGG